VLCTILDMDFYEKAHFVKPTWRLLSVAEAQLLMQFARYASIRTFGEPTLRWLGAYDEIRVDSATEGAAIFRAVSVPVG